MKRCNELSRLSTHFYGICHFNLTMTQIAPIRPRHVLNRAFINGLRVARVDTLLSWDFFRDWGLELSVFPLMWSVVIVCMYRWRGFVGNNVWFLSDSRRLSVELLLSIILDDDMVWGWISIYALGEDDNIGWRDGMGLDIDICYGWWQ